jgi:hypothetical protein
VDLNLKVAFVFLINASCYMHRSLSFTVDMSVNCNAWDKTKLQYKETRTETEREREREREREVQNVTFHGGNSIFYSPFTAITVHFDFDLDCLGKRT